MWNVNFSVGFFPPGMGFLGYFEPELVFLCDVRSQEYGKCDVLSTSDTATKGTMKTGLAK